MTSTVQELSQHVEAQAAFAVEWHRQPLPQGVERFGRLLLLDTLGALVGGTRYPQVRALRDRLPPASPADCDHPFASLFRLGTASTWLDADSGGSFHPQGHRLPPVPTAHPAPHVLPVLLHAAARGHCDDELVHVFVLATEIGLRFGTATSLRPGMHPHGIHGPVAATVAASLLRGHSPALMASAMVRALATPVAARLWSPMQGSTVRNAWTGLGAYYGARAAAEAGQRPPLGAGVAAAALDAVVTPDSAFNLLSDGLGARWVISDSYLKPYACARWIHPALDATLAALAARTAACPQQRAEQIERIEVETFAFAASLSATDVRSDLHARFSLPVCISTVALDGELHAQGFLPERLSRPEVSALARAVTVRENADFSAALPRDRPSTVTVTWQDGEKASRHVRNARGNPDDPLSTEEVAAKFRANVATVLTDEVRDKCVTALTHLGRSARSGREAALPGVAALLA